MILPSRARPARARRRTVLCWLWLLSGALAGMLPSVAAAAPAPRVAPSPGREQRLSADLSVRELAPGVWLHRSWGRDSTGERAPANGLVVRDARGVVIVDTPWGNAPTAALLDWIARELKEPVLGVVVTHAHDDRIGGARVVRERGIPLLASPRTVEVAAGRRLEYLPMALAGLDEDEAVLVGPLEVYYPGPAHTPDNVVVWLPEQRVLFAGCIARAADSSSLGFSGDANLARWPEALRRVKQRYADATLVIPGHGAPGGETLLDRTRVLLARRMPTAKPSPRRPAPTRAPAPRRTPEPVVEPAVEPTPGRAEVVIDEPTPGAPAVLVIDEEPTVTPARILLPAEQPH